MIDFSTVKGLIIPEGDVGKIIHNGEILWSAADLRYVSLGDSIAAGHTIDENWETDYGYGSQYGSNGNTSTVIVPNCYTDLIRRDLANIYGEEYVTATSFAKSGDTVEDLMDKLSHNVVKSEIAKANLVTICIGANDILGVVSEDRIMEYISSGSLSAIEAEVEANLNILNTDSNPYSYVSLMDKLNRINPNAKYVFTVIYNPYKYLWIEEGNNGFFKPLLDTIPNLTFFGFDIDNIIKDQLLSMDLIEMLFERMNGLSEWVEHYISILNQILRNKVNTYSQTVNQNFMVAETKTLFESFPDRPYSAAKHYNDLISVEYTRGYDTMQMDWGKLYEGTNALSFWTNLVTKYVSITGLDMGGLTNELLPQIVEKVVMPDLDPHPETYGQYVMSRSFEDTLGYIPLDRHIITFNNNGGSGTMENQVVVGVDGLPAFTHIQANKFASVVEGYYHNGWNTLADGNGVAYSNGQYISIASDLSLYAQWSNMYKITYKHTNKTIIYTDDETGHQECYALWIEGNKMPALGKFNEGRVETYIHPYGTRVGVVVSGYNPTELTYDDADTDIYWNGVSVAQGYGDRAAMYEFTLTSDITVDFQWKVAGSLATLDAKSWEDCYITTH